MDRDLQADVEDIQAIPAVPTILDVVCRTTGLGFAAVARVTEDRWIACQVLDNIQFGLRAGEEIRLETTLCNEIRQHQQAVVIDEVASDPVYASHHTPNIYGFQSYISVPIVLSGGRFFGTLCAIDHKPAKLNSTHVVDMFTLFAQLIAHQIEAREKLTAATGSLLDERRTAELREQFIAVLGHDLRSPVGSMEAGINRMLRKGWTEETPTLLRLMKASAGRARGIIDNVMDLARARLGGGIGLTLEADRSPEETIVQVVEETKTLHPDRTVECAIHIDRPVPLDHARIGQMLSNLLGNAVSHGSADVPIRVSAATREDRFDLSVTNGGNPIPEMALGQMFQPFMRGTAKSEGLGLGLYIASQIATAHGGTIDVLSDERETRFTFSMPLAG